MSSSNSCFFTCIRVSQEAVQLVLYSHLFQNFPQFVVIYTVKGFGVINKAEIDFFLEFPCFFYDPTNDGNLISGSSAFSKTSLNIWKFMVHILLKSGLENFEHCFASVWDECNCAVVWTFFGIAFLWDWNKNWPLPVLEFSKFAGILNAALSQHKLLQKYRCIYETWVCSVAQPCPTLCNPLESSPPVSSVHEIFQARILEWVAVSSSRRSSQTKDQTCISCIGRWILYLWAIWEDSYVRYLLFYSLSLMSDSLQPLGLPQASLSLTISWSLLNVHWVSDAI